MKLFTVKKMPDPREPGYADALVHWIEHFVKLTHGKAFVLFTSYKLMQEAADPHIVNLGAKAASGGIINGVAADEPSGEEQEGGRGGEGASYWFALALGTGGGYHSGTPRQTPETTTASLSRVPAFPWLGRFRFRLRSAISSPTACFCRCRVDFRS